MIEITMGSIKDIEVEKHHKSTECSIHLFCRGNGKITIVADREDFLYLSEKIESEMRK